MFESYVLSAHCSLAFAVGPCVQSIMTCYCKIEFAEFVCFEGTFRLYISIPNGERKLPICM